MGICGSCFSGRTPRGCRGVFGILSGHSGRGASFHRIVVTVQTRSRADTIGELTWGCTRRRRPMARGRQAESNGGDTNGTFPSLQLQSTLKPSIGNRLKRRNRLSRVYLGVNSDPPYASLIKRNLSYSKIGGRYGWISRFEAVLPCYTNVTNLVFFFTA